MLPIQFTATLVRVVVWLFGWLFDGWVWKELMVSFGLVVGREEEEEEEEERERKESPFRE